MVIHINPVYHLEGIILIGDIYYTWFLCYSKVIYLNFLFCIYRRKIVEGPKSSLSQNNSKIFKTDLSSLFPCSFFFQAITV